MTGKYSTLFRSGLEKFTGLDSSQTFGLGT